MPITQEQANEMREQIRSEKGAGRPEVAARIQKALDRGEFYEAKPVVPELPTPIPPTSGPGSKKEVWDAFALAESDLDPEVIEAASKKDLITMLRANGIIPKEFVGSENE